MNITDLKELLLRDNSTLGTTFLSVYQVIDLLDKIEIPEAKAPAVKVSELDGNLSYFLCDRLERFDFDEIVDKDNVELSINSYNTIEVESVQFDISSLNDYICDNITEYLNQYFNTNND